MRSLLVATVAAFLLVGCADRMLPGKFILTVEKSLILKSNTLTRAAA